MHLSGKTIIDKDQPSGSSLPADFNLPEIDASIRDKGYDVIREKAYLCPCKSDVSAAALSTCKNCGGSGWIFANPTKTRMLIIGLAADAKMKEAALRDWGLIDMGTVKVTALNDDKFTYMDRIRVLDATAEYQQLLYPRFSDDDAQVFAFAQYDILSVDYLALFVDENTPLQKLEEPADYSFVDNTFIFTDLTLDRKQLTVRYTHRPVFHILDVLRESMTSTKGQFGGQKKLIMPIHAIAKRAHLIKDAENFIGDRLLDNSWLTNSSCTPVEFTKFQRQLRYTPVQDIYGDLTEQQKIDLFNIFSESW